MDDLIRQASAALKAGNKTEARRLLSLAIKENPNDERAWGWMYNAALTDMERSECLKQMLRINPQNEKASQLLKELDGLEPPLESPIRTLPKTDAEKLKSAGNALSKTGVTLTLFVTVPICLCLMVFFFFSLNGSGGSAGTNVKYKIAGSAQSALVTYMNGQGGTEQATVNLPYEKDLTAKFGTFLSLVAQNQGGGSITCEIWVNDNKTSTSTSTAQYGVVTCSDISK